MRLCAFICNLLAYACVHKVDPDAVFFASRLRSVVGKYEEAAKGVYLNNCKFGLHGPIEAAAARARGGGAFDAGGRPGAGPGQARGQARGGPGAGPGPAEAVRGVRSKIDPRRALGTRGNARSS